MAFSPFRQSGAVPYRFVDGELRILLITSRKRKRWIFPKGIIEPDMTPSESALNEAWEEAGVRGAIEKKPFESYVHKKWKGRAHVDMYLLKVESTKKKWPEKDERKRKWLSLEDAIEKVSQKSLKRVLKAVPEALQKRKVGSK